MQMVMSMKVIGVMIRIMAQVNTSIMEMEHSSRAAGSRTPSQVQAVSRGQMVPYFKVSMLTERSMDEDCLSGRMGQYLTVTSKTTIYTDKETISGLMADHI